MFDNDPKDLAATLSAMHKTALEKSNYDRNEAKQRFKLFVQTDRRFDDFDKDALTDRVAECKSNGAVLDLEDPRLRGLPHRPLDRWS